MSLSDILIKTPKLLILKIKSRRITLKDEVVKVEEKHELNTSESIGLELVPYERRDVLEIGDDYIYADESYAISEKNKKIVKFTLGVKKAETLSDEDKSFDHIGFIKFFEEVYEYGINSPPTLMAEVYISDANYKGLKDKIGDADNLHVSILPFEEHLDALDYGNSSNTIKWHTAKYNRTQLILKIMELRVNFKKIDDASSTNSLIIDELRSLSKIISSILHEMKTIKFALIAVVVCLIIKLL